MPHKSYIIIPARWGSQRFPGKPIFKIDGKPLIQHVWERAVKVKNADEVIIATDHSKIKDEAEKFGAKVIMTSDKHLSGSDRIAEAVLKIEKSTNPHDVDLASQENSDSEKKNNFDDIIINIQGDEPLIDHNVIEDLIDFLNNKDHDHYNVATVANEITSKEEINNPNIVKVVMDQNSDGLYFSRSKIPYTFNDSDIKDGDTSDIKYFRHQGIYGYKKFFLLKFTQLKPSMLEKAERLEQLRIIHNNEKIHVIISDYAAPGVDTVEQALEVEQLIKKNK